MFIRSIMVFDDQVLPKKIFMERARRVFNNLNDHELYENLSVVFDLLKTTDIFHISDEVQNMVERGHTYEKFVSKKRDWEWSLNDIFGVYKYCCIKTLICQMESLQGWST